MKQSAAKTLGVAALGAAFAVSAAGSASALTTVPTGPVLKTAAEALPVGQLTSALPGGEDETATLAEGTLRSATEAAPAVPVDTPLDPVLKLLGGLPVGTSLPVPGLG
ncbi:ATP-binding protein [Streptomyces sp. TRM76323]|uniref:ATP-binding protein n=1 Tax=Streptomyces tamarix TaxID=3078565 RepID=A0ABU3QK91_9ACTN|nr:ATP-binding protein [Streptomyces tamarix]MDT9683180.1 ATP-binding protein [Streptomyces tamarix]